MANNTAMIFGRVTNRSSGGGIGGAEVSLNFLFGEVALGQVRTGGDDSLKTYAGWAKTNSEGKYIMPFFWEAADIGKVTDGATASVLAMLFHSDGTNTSKNQRGRLVLTLDIKKLIAVGYPSLPASAPDAVNIAKDFYISYREMLPKGKTLYPSTPLLSTEVFGLLGKIDLALG